jgi:hypothetical protein
MNDSSNSGSSETNVQRNEERIQAQKLQGLIMGFRTTQIIATAARLNLAEHLKDGPKTYLQLASITRTDARTLYRLMIALTNLDIVEKNADGTFSISVLGKLLEDHAQGSLRYVAMLYGEPWLWEAYAHLPYSLMSGRPAFEYIHGQTLYDFLGRNAPAAEIFNKAMSAFSIHEAQAIKKVFPFSGTKTMIDVGGGKGTFMTSLLEDDLHLRAVVFDQPSVSDRVGKNSDSLNRIAYVSGDFFKEVPGGGDIYLLKSVLHNWDDQACMAILKNCHTAMHENARLLIIERIIPEGNERSEGKFFDINMLVMTNGRERTEKEYKKLLDDSGFTLLRVISTESAVSIIEASLKN